MKRKHFLAVILSFSLVLMVGTGAFAAGLTAGSRGSPIQSLTEVLSGVLPGIIPAAPPIGHEDKLDLFLQVWKIVSQEFYQQPVDHDVMIRGAIRGMLETLGDPHTILLDPLMSERARENTRQKFQGIGARIKERDGQIFINSVFPDSPAERGGLQSGDIIMAVDGTPLEGDSAYETASRIRGTAGTDVVLTIKRGEEEPFDLTLTRAEVDIPSLSSQTLAGNVGYIKLWSFGALTADELRTELETLVEAQMPGLILDLRDNPGGLLSTAIQVTGEFLNPGAVVLYEQQATHQLRPYRVGGIGVARQIPLVVLVNERSASASEIVAGALAHYDRAVIIGQRTYGKGTVQLPHDLSDGSQLRVTIARWLTPGKESISDVGISPAIEVEADVTLHIEDDVAVQRALQELTKLAALPDVA
jgi:carboxyl-terminal processing protease